MDELAERRHRNALRDAMLGLSIAYEPPDARAGQPALAEPSQRPTLDTVVAEAPAAKIVPGSCR